MADIVLERINAVWFKVHCEAHIKYELNDFFSFRPKGYQFNPMFRNKIWDGYIRIFKAIPSLLYVGLQGYMEEFCKSREYSLEVKGVKSCGEDVHDDYGYELASDTKYKARTYQNAAVVQAIRDSRRLLLSPTASGKSFIIYLIAKHYLKSDKRSLLIVPTLGLVSQMRGDFIDYGHDPDDIHMITGGVTKNSLCGVTVATWQSLQKIPPEWLQQFDVIFIDEAHTAQAKSLAGLLEKATTIEHRFGLTGTLGGDSKSHRLVLEGLIGPVMQVEKTSKLIEDGTLANLTVKGIVLGYKDEERKLVSKMTYPDQRNFIFAHDRRNKFITSLVGTLKDKNTLLLFDRVEKHGKILIEYLKTLEKKGFTVHFIYGGNSDAEDRERIRQICESSVNNVVLASTKIFSTGVNIKQLHCLIFTSAERAQITLLQSIGRLLRKTGKDDNVTAYDLTDDLSWKSKKNYAINHFVERIAIYLKEKFKFKQYNVEL